MNWILRGIVVGMVAIGAAAGAEHEYDFRERMDPAAYEAAVAKLPAEAIDPEKVRASKLPLWGVRILAVEPDGQAAEKGLEAGWVIDRYNGREYWHHKQPMAAGPDEPRVVEMVTPEGERREVEFGPGRLGIRVENAHQRGLHMMRNVPEAPWNRELLIADAAWREGEHRVAETALRHAVEKGMPAGRFSRYFAMQLAADAGNAGLSEKLLDDLLEEVFDNGEVPRFYRPGVRTLALAHGKLDLLRENLQELAGFRDELQMPSVALWEKWREDGWPDSVLADAREKAGEDLMPAVVPVEDGWEKFFEAKDPEPLRNGAHAGFTRPPAYEHFVFKPDTPVKNARFEIRGAFGDVGEPRPFHELTLQLIDLGKRARWAERGAWNQALWTVAGIRIRREMGYGQVCYLSAGPVMQEIPTHREFPSLNAAQVARTLEQVRAGEKPAVPEEAKFAVTLIKSGRTAEIAVNGVSYLRVAMDPDVGELGCVVHSTGMVVVIEEITLRELPEN